MMAEILSLVVLIAAFGWLISETDWLRVRLLIGALPQPPQAIELERISWDVCKSRYNKGREIKLLLGTTEPLCGWDWLKNNTHPIPQAIVDIQAGGVRYHWDIKDTVILNDAIKSLHYKKPKSNGQLRFTRNKLGGLVAPLPAKAR